MANTDKQNFRYDGALWAQAIAKAAEMREDGYDIDMTRLLAAEVDRFLAERPALTVEKLRLVKRKGPLPIYRRPEPRDARVGES